MLHDREPETGSPRRPRAVRAVEALEQPRELRLLDPDAVVAADERHRVASTLDGEREGRAGAGVADRVLGEVPRDHAEHARPDRQLDVVGAFDPDLDARSGGALLELLDGLVQHGLHRRRAERDDARARLELREEQHLVDELGDLVDLAAGLLDERGDVLARERGRLEEREEPGERSAELVRDGGRETRPELLVGREISFPREVDETLAPTADLVRDDERDDAALAGEQVRGEVLALDEAVDRLARTAAREQDAIVVAEHDHGLAALLDERPASDRVGVGHPHPSNRTLADRLPRAHGARTHMSVNACVPRKGERA